MVTELKRWGSWELTPAGLTILTPRRYPFSISLADIKNEQMTKIIIGMMAVKPWITTQDLIDLKKAIRDLRK